MSLGHGLGSGAGIYIIGFFQFGLRVGIRCELEQNRICELKSKVIDQVRVCAERTLYAIVTGSGAGVC